MAIKIKNAKQIEGIRNASRLAAECLKYLEQFVVEGVTTKELDTRAAEFMKKHNARSATLGYRGHGVQPFSGNICTSPNDVICHGVPNDYTLKNGDILNIDVGKVGRIPLEHHIFNRKNIGNPQRGKTSNGDCDTAGVTIVYRNVI